MLMPRFLVPFSSVTCFKFEVPEVDTSVLPLRSSRLTILALALDIRRLAVTKVVTTKDTCCWRSRLLVVEPHSISTVPFAISGIRVAEVTG